MTYYIYALSDRKGIRYVGQSNDPKLRLIHHLGGAKRGEATPKAAWLRSLIRRRRRPTLTILDSGGNANKKEREWVERCVSEGCDLLNTSYKCIPRRFRVIGGEVFIPINGKLFTFSLSSRVIPRF
jgi:hypothetical protein